MTNVFDKIPFKAEWIAALRSGKYEQGCYRLKSKDGYCCLGVWAEIAGHKFNETVDGLVNSETGDCVGYAPIEAAFGGAHISGLFITMNDGQGRSFEQIADMAERNFKTFGEAQKAIRNKEGSDAAIA